MTNGAPPPLSVICHLYLSSALPSFRARPLSEGLSHICLCICFIDCLSPLKHKAYVDCNSLSLGHSVTVTDTDLGHQYMCAERMKNEQMLCASLFHILRSLQTFLTTCSVSFFPLGLLISLELFIQCSEKTLRRRWSCTRTQPSPLWGLRSGRAHWEGQNLEADRSHANQVVKVFPFLPYDCFQKWAHLPSLWDQKETSPRKMH